jgi:hypothetical protein
MVGLSAAEVEGLTAGTEIGLMRHWPDIEITIPLGVRRADIVTVLDGLTAYPRVVEHRPAYRAARAPLVLVLRHADHHPADAPEALPVPVAAGEGAGGVVVAVGATRADLVARLTSADDRRVFVGHAPVPAASGSHVALSFDDPDRGPVGGETAAGEGQPRPSGIMVGAFSDGPEIEVLIPVQCARVDVAEVLSELRDYPYFVDHYEVSGAGWAAYALVLRRDASRYLPGERVQAADTTVTIPRGALRPHIAAALLHDPTAVCPDIVGHRPEPAEQDEGLVLVFGRAPGRGGPR